MRGAVQNLSDNQDTRFSLVVAGVPTITNFFPGFKKGACRREGTYVYLWLIHDVVKQKPIKQCKAIILQLKNKYIYIYTMRKKDRGVKLDFK